MIELEMVSWPPPGSAPRLRRNDLHLWKIPCGTGGIAACDLWPILSRRERDKATRLRAERQRTRFVRAHAGLRLILAEYSDIAPREIAFSRGNAGKPGIAGGLEFNLTTSADLALVAVCLGQPVGIDCEFIRPHSDLNAIARRMFTTNHAERVAAAPESDRLVIFTCAWTALEASVKADGRGLFRSRKVPPMPELDITHCVPERGYIAAVARADLPPVSEWTTLTLA